MHMDTPTHPITVEYWQPEIHWLLYWFGRRYCKGWRIRACMAVPGNALYYDTLPWPVPPNPTAVSMQTQVAINALLKMHVQHQGEPPRTGVTHVMQSTTSH